MKIRTTLAALAVVFITPALAAAQQITITHQASGSGNLAGVPFSNTSFLITATADVSNVQSLGFGWSLDHTTAEIDITGVGIFQFSTQTRTFVNNSVQLVGFSRGGTSGTDLLNGPSDGSFATWDMLTTVAPITGPGSLIQWSSGDILVDAGVLNMDSSSPEVTFSADLCNVMGSAYCFGDGTGALCPCAAFGGAGEGCANTGGGGATLTGSGNACVQSDTLVFDVAGVPGAKPGLLLRGDSQIANPAGDGILCTAGGSQRSQVQVTAAGGTTFSDFGGQPFGAIANVGAPTNFQFWYRDPANTCSGGGFNFSNAWTVTYQP